MTAPLDAASSAAGNAAVPSTPETPVDPAVVAELAAGVASAQRMLLQTFWAMAAASVQPGLRAARPAIAGEAALP